MLIHSMEPLAVSFGLALILSLALRMLPQHAASSTPDFVGAEISIRSGTSGKYVEVGDNLWLYAAYCAVRHASGMASLYW